MKEQSHDEASGLTFPYTDDDLELIRRQCRERQAKEPNTQSVHYEAGTGRLYLELHGGAILSFVARDLDELRTATDAQLARVRIVDGRALFWDDLDVQMSLIALLQDVLQVRLASDVAQQAGRVSSGAKAQAARENGKKGGRPRHKPMV